MVSGFYLVRRSRHALCDGPSSVLCKHDSCFTLVESFESHDLKVRSLGRGDESTCFPIMWPGFDSQIQLTCNLYLLVFCSAS